MINVVMFARRKRQRERWFVFEDGNGRKNVGLYSKTANVDGTG